MRTGGSGAVRTTWRGVIIALRARTALAALEAGCVFGYHIDGIDGQVVSVEVSTPF
jgi:hypothetical protein